MTQSFEHQLEACRRSKGRAEFAYFMEMGTGKSKADIDDTLHHLKTAHLDGWLHVALVLGWIAAVAAVWLALAVAVFNRGLRRYSSASS